MKRIKVKIILLSEMNGPIVPKLPDICIDPSEEFLKQVDEYIERRMNRNEVSESQTDPE